MAVEYKIDETQRTASQVWSFTHSPAVFATFMGDTQRLPDGNTFMEWGAPSSVKGYSYISMTEVDPAGHTLFELAFDAPFVSYRAFRAPWQGSPDTLPTLAFENDPNGLTLGYSWNGATQVAAYNVYGGISPKMLGLIEQKPKTDFETQTHLTGLPQNECYFQVAALDPGGRELARSRILTIDPSCPGVR